MRISEFISAIDVMVVFIHIHKTAEREITATRIELKEIHCDDRIRSDLDFFANRIL